MSGYRQTYDQWRADPQAFWAEAARHDWTRAPERIFDEAGVYGRWFPERSVNACFNALDRHVVAGRGDQRGDPLRQSRHRTKRRSAMPNCSTRSRRWPRS